MNNRIFLAFAILALMTTGAFAKDNRGKSSDYDKSKHNSKWNDCDTPTQKQTNTCKDEKIRVNKDCDPPKDKTCYVPPTCPPPAPPVCPPTPPCVPVPPVCPPVGPPTPPNNGCETVPEPASMTALGAGIVAMIKRRRLKK